MSTLTLYFCMVSKYCSCSKRIRNTIFIFIAITASVVIKPYAWNHGISDNPVTIPLFFFCCT